MALDMDGPELLPVLDLLQLDIMDSEMPPSWKPGGDDRFLLGTDAQGRGVLSTIMYGTGTGSEIMQRIAAPMIGGMVTATLLTLFVIPSIFVIWKRLALKRVNREITSPIQQPVDAALPAE